MCKTEESVGMRERAEVLTFRMRPDRVELMQAIADAEYGGNRSAMIVDLIERRISQRFPRFALPGYKEVA